MVTVRKAEGRDEEGVFALLGELFGDDEEEGPGSGPEGVATFHRILQEGVGAFLVAEEEGRLLGLITLSFPLAIRCGGRYACIEEFIVLPEARGKGVGGALLEAAIALSAAEGCHELQVNRPSELGYPVYLEHGWEDLGRHLSLRPVASRR